ncbi:conjugal transfer mating-pair stabilization protein TraG [Gilliamella sp. BG7]|uniref:conjugal transfer mating-pair stabilization protein TraG n=1 Tax=unclassified Gilliamella TaxID=2685620 RepID=UPI003987F7A8
MLDVYVLTGGEIFYQIMNAIAAFFNSSSWGMLIRWSLNIAVIGGMVRFIGTNDLVKLLRWVFIYIFIVSVLVVPKKNIQIIDLSDRLSVYKVDNVPLGLAVLFSFSTKIGFGIAEMYDQFFSVPDAVSYSKTGFLFGANLAKDSIYASLPNGILTDNLNSYVTNCVIGDIMLNHKYSLDELMDSTDTLELITSNASPIRRMIYKGQGNSKQNISCKEGANSIKADLTSVFSKNGSIIGTLNRITYSDKAAKEMIIKELLQDSYSFFHNSSKSAVDILKRNVVNNAVRKGINSFAGKQGDVAGIIAVSAENSQLKSRLNWAISSQIATTYLPMLHTVMILLLFGLFPIVIILTVSDVMGVRPLQLYALSIVYFMSWLPLFSILNYVMVYYTKSSLNGVDVTLNNADRLKIIHSDIGMISGYLSLSIPFLALGIVKGFSTIATNASNFLSASISGAISQVSSSAADGNWNIGNMSTENVQGFKWDTNYNHSSGNMSQQLSNGAISTMATDGTSGINTSTIMSHLPTTGSISRNVTQQFNQAMRYVESMSASALDGLNSNSRALLSNLSQLQNAVNKGGSYTRGYSDDQIADIRRSANDAMNIVQRYASQHNVSEEEAVNYLNFKSSAANLGINAALAGTLGLGASVVALSGTLSGNASAEFRTGSQDEIRHSSNERFNESKDDSSDLAKRWAYDINNLSSYKLNFNGNEVNNHNQALLDNISNSYERAIASSKSYNESKTIGYNLSQEKNNITSGNSVIHSNLNNEFVKWIRGNYPMDANEILSNTSDSNVAAQREQLWDEFANHYVSNRINTIIDNASPSFKQKYIQNANTMKKETGLEDSYNQMSDKVSQNRLERNNWIAENKGKINSEVDKLREKQKSEQSINEQTIKNVKNEGKSTHDVKGNHHSKETQKIRNVYKEANDDQAFIDPNPIQQNMKDTKNKNFNGGN